MKDLINTITRSVFGSDSTAIEAIVGMGKNNQVFKIIVDDAPHILRLYNSEVQLAVYEKEKWCAEAVIKVGIKTPSITQTGILNGWSYSFQEYIEGTNGTEADVDRVWFALGNYAKIMHQIPADEITLNYPQKLQKMFGTNFYVEKEIFSAELSEKIESRLAETLSWNFAPMLCHGNLHPSNVMMDREGVVWVIDWETATGNITPTADLAEIYAWNNGKENIATFFEGYGLTKEDVETKMRDIQTLVLMRLMEVIQRMVAKAGGSVDQTNDYIRDTVQRLESVSDFQQDILFTKNL